jgi:hypothetical protein
MGSQYNINELELNCCPKLAAFVHLYLLVQVFEYVASDTLMVYKLFVEFSDPPFYPEKVSFKVDSKMPVPK